MEIKLDKRFAIDAPIGAAWWVLRDVKGVAECMPGAEITEQVDDSHYKGQVRVKLGPATAAFRGDLHLEAVDAEKHAITLMGRGTEMKGGSAASMHLVAQLYELAPDRCELVGSAEVTLTGKMASFAGRMMRQVADQILKQFGDRLAERVRTHSAAAMAKAPTLTPPAEAVQKPAALNAFTLLRQTAADLLRPGRRSKPPASR